jgi:hypothetical protein
MARPVNQRPGAPSRVRVCVPSQPKGTTNMRDGFIWIDTYRRIREGKVEQVCGHWRRLPRGRKSATVIPFPHPSVA